MSHSVPHLEDYDNQVRMRATKLLNDRKLDRATRAMVSALWEIIISPDRSDAKFGNWADGLNTGLAGCRNIAKGAFLTDEEKRKLMI